LRRVLTFSKSLFFCSPYIPFGDARIIRRGKGDGKDETKRKRREPETKRRKR
jgi:hypothetical protein